MPFSGHVPRKRFGQHWLRDDSILEKILLAADLQEEDRILEIGPGRGALTEKLLESNVKLVHGVELDAELIVGLKQRFAGQSRFTLQEGDALSVSLLPHDGIAANKVVANIPYNITGPLLERLIGRLGRSSEVKYQRLVLLVQKEVAKRILALPGQSSFSAMSVRLQLLAKCQSVCEVHPSSFSPQPKVYSEVIILDPLEKDERLDFLVERRVASIVQIAFLSRRKKLRNTLTKICPLDELEPLAYRQGINLNQRPQELAPMIWVQLARELERWDRSKKK
ncbi:MULTISPECIES: 16S rRNA (adenine(1518)-N(6)/adenine(1519)-N(6))-dimethyltransferase RsmA [Prochlorococcus]|uniref:Ribosomal RNA small subunit methyltransferase A n=1 Tax=Prochlorococcus marinus (strain SARG / CCMP1375 / SS120) TaxID=167539 RepID=RSMA_PROMA|nr:MULTISPECIES: 16S rRNA (adenine(1518)-N(6)/adenine(1519)-N(6))-dimethyltransferase RsmA [Prochlorococcus]Q7VCH7.1 RecName: Full=Ribosomal RNA small subunit methyltransferase A; AltName: Full=16S rRNA (adenine(1518)-N(6)/adenine(1519)-N(6))-dimethyltransferase; AltName: Full=16S rRNA dimethyladenosine transferase; AltName: Full=16S rRNA dimethylase; AltName: Full=S-adenosylmethionine-6-N', N'-adenosyl(rRNA) dimethyltransferase [Prochlorococcus marinus subsp. marinus str. CCMP1375]AAP99807.1 Dim